MLRKMMIAWKIIVDVLKMIAGVVLLCCAKWVSTGPIYKSKLGEKLRKIAKWGNHVLYLEGGKRMHSISFKVENVHW